MDFGDDLHPKIVAGLSRITDVRLFEQAACSLLVDALPSLAPVQGGSDDGADGTFVSPTGKPGILIVTTDEDVIGNLTGSLKQWLAKGHTPCTVALATSRALSMRRLNNLRHRAEELGFEWFNHYDRQALADRLLSNPGWRKRLLGLEGHPRALSAEPKTSRRILDLPLVGRSQELAWLTNLDLDGILVGQPGSGKTFLLQETVRRNLNWGLFIVDPDLGRIADDYRELQPRRLIADDAHVEPSFLLGLSHLRKTLGLEFRIVAVTWPGSLREIEQALPDVRSSSIRELPVLSRDQIVEIFRGAGLADDRDLLARLTDLCAGKPGLAATLIQLLRDSSPGESLKVDDLVRRLYGGVSALVGDRRASDVLSCFALGGSSGMGLQEVAEYLRLDLATVRTIVTDLAAAGVLRDLYGNRLSVAPPDLRWSRVKETFLAVDGAGLDPRPLVERAPSFESAVISLLRGRGFGGRIDEEYLRSLVLRSKSAEAFAGYASLGPAQTRWVLEEFSGGLEEIAHEALVQAPADTIRALLASAAARSSPGIEDELDPIRRWLTERQTTEESLQRRRLVIDTVLEQLSYGLPRVLARKLLFWALSPDLDFSESDPGNGYTISIHRGALGSAVAGDFRRMWAQIRDALTPFGVEDWPDLNRCLAHWVHPEMDYLATSLPADQRDAKRYLAREVLQDVAASSEWNPALASALEDRGRDLGLSLAISLDPEFELLFPAERGKPEELEESESNASVQVAELAGIWAERDPQDALRHLTELCTGAKLIQRTWPNRSQFLVDCIATATSQPQAWLIQILEGGLASAWAVPFLREVWQRGTEVDRRLVFSALRNSDFRRAAVFALLWVPAASEDLLRELETACSENLDLVETAALRRDTPESTLGHLLGSSIDTIAAAAAIGCLWGESRFAELSLHNRELAVEAVLRASPTSALFTEARSYLSHGFVDVIARDPNVSGAWTSRHLSALSIRSESRMEDQAVAKILGVLDAVTRRQLIERLPPETNDRFVVAHLVGGDLSAYSLLLARLELGQVHLAPLSAKVEPFDTSLAQLALDNGHREADVATELSRCREWTWSRGSRLERDFEDILEALRTTQDHRLIRVAGLLEEELRVLDQRHATD